MMKLISCHVENFGAISSADFDFTDGINQFCKPNGFGKSTLAAFIKAMFYGLPAAKTNSKFNDRIHYKPFSGGKYGGNITFWANGKEYRIERFFGGKTEADDTLNAFENGAPTSIFDARNSGGRTVGEIIFGLDEQSFLRTAYVTGEGAEMRATGCINAKLNNYVFAVEGERDAKAAQTALDEAAKALKKRGGKGEIEVQKAKISDLKNTVENLKTIEKSLAGRYDERKALTDKISQLERTEKERNRREVALGKWAIYDNITSSTEAKSEELAALSKKYPAGLPDSGELSALAASTRNATALAARLNAVGLSAEKQGRLSELSNLFESGVPDRDGLEAAQKGVDRLREIKVEKDGLCTSADEKYAALKSRFENRAVSEAELEARRADVKRYELARSELLELSERQTPSPQPARRRKNLYAAVAAVIAAACFIGGAAIISAWQVAAIALFAVGAVGLAAAVIIMSIGRGRVKASPDSAAATASVKARMKAAEDEIRAFLVPYGVYSSDVVYDFKRFEDDLNEYAALNAAQIGERKKLDSLCEEESGLTERLKTYFSAYGLSGDLAANLTDLNALVGEYTRLNGEKKAAENLQAELKSQLADAEKTIAGVLGKYGITEGEGDINSELARDGELISRLKREVEEGRKKAEKFKSENSLTDRPAPVAGGDFAEELSLSRRQLADLDRVIADDEVRIDTLNEYVGRLEIAEEELKELNTRYEVLTAAGRALKLAEDRLNEEYVSPIKREFTKLAKVMEKVADVKVVMGKDFALSFESGGELRSADYLSAGQRAAWSLCFRLALIDNMYADEKPFIIMDDPFADLDEDGLAKAKNLLSELSKDRQFIYFCCHESRRM
ncbi:MAG: AAA family ATPase [Candidatus Coproplasma sp.]